MTRKKNPALFATSSVSALSRPIALMVASLTCAGVAAAAPQSESAARDQSLDEIVVTAQRRAETLQSVPIAISAIRGDDLTERGVLNLQDLSASVPSLNVQNRRASGVVTIRGIGFDVATAGADPAVAVHVDGVYMARPVSALTNFFDMERVEIARGPQGTLYGRNATGGAVNLITRKPSQETSGYLDAAVGNYGAIELEGAVGGGLSDSVSARVAFKHSQRDGYGENKFLGKDINDLDASSVRGQLLFGSGDAFSLLVGFDYFRQDDAAFVSTFSGFPVACATTAPARRCGTAYGGQVSSNLQDVLHDFDPVNERSSRGVSATAEWNLDAVTVRSISSWRNTKYVWEVDGDQTTFNMGFVGRDEDSDQISEELQVLGETENFKWLLGGFYFTEDNDALGYADAPIPDFRTLEIRQFARLKTDAWAIFGQGTYSLSDQLSVTVGGRYSSEKKTIEGEIAQQLPGVVPTPDPTRSQSWSKFTPKLTIDYQVSDDVLIYAGAQQGFKSGGYAAGARTPAFNPEEIWSYEVGMKGTFADGKVTANLAAFQFKYKDLQVGFVQNRPGGAVVTVVTNAAEAKNHGLEAEIVARVTDNFRLEANASFMKARFERFLTVDSILPLLGEQDLSGNALAYAPDLSGSVAAQWDVPMGSGDLAVRAEYVYSDKIFFDAYNRAGEVMAQSAFGLSNLYVNYTPAGNWKFGAFVRNLSDKEYRLGAAISGGIWGSVAIASPGTPRTFGVRATYSF
jgi:iron complex outermembrane receptor protein